MYRTMMLAFVLLTSAAWLQAQAGYGQAGNTANTAGQTRVEGCLQGSNGNYTLTADNGTTYQLTGDTAKLGDHVGHEMRITGTTSAASSSSASSGAMSSSGPQPTLNVTSFKHVSKTCKSSSMGK